MTRTCDKNIYEFRWILTNYEQRTKGQEKIQMTLDYTLFTNNTHLFNFSFDIGKKEIINWKPKK